MGDRIIETRAQCCVLTHALPHGVQKPGVVHIGNRNVVYDDFVVSVRPNQPMELMFKEMFNYLTIWGCQRLGVTIIMPPNEA
jgi:hypothetical protein